MAAETPIQRVGSYAFITAEEHVLLSLLNRGPNRGRWTLIGGGIEFGESPLEALHREIYEESGIRSGAEAKLWDVSSHTHLVPEDGQKAMHFIGIIYRIELPRMLPAKADGDGFSSDGTRWFSLKHLEVNSPEFPIHPSVQRLLAKL